LDNKVFNWYYCIIPEFRLDGRNGMLMSNSGEEEFLKMANLDTWNEMKI